MTFIDYHINNKISQETFQEFYSLLENSFPIEERRIETQQFNLLSNSDYHILGIYNNEKFIGFITFWDLDNCIFYEHFATDPTLRNSGIGAATLKHLEATHKKPCFLEIELPHDELAIRRQKFYEKQGFTTCAFDYYQPPFHQNYPNLPLWIMSKNVDVDEISFLEYKKTIYRDIYNINI